MFNFDSLWIRKKLLINVTKYVSNKVQNKNICYVFIIWHKINNFVTFCLRNLPRTSDYINTGCIIFTNTNVQNENKIWNVHKNTPFSRCFIPNTCFLDNIIFKKSFEHCEIRISSNGFYL